jgi:hypothetical protein
VRLRSTGSTGVVGIIMGEEDGGGVYALELGIPWLGARRPEEKRLE